MNGGLPELWVVGLERAIQFSEESKSVFLIHPMLFIDEYLHRYSFVGRLEARGHAFVLLGRCSQDLADSWKAPGRDQRPNGTYHI